MTSDYILKAEQVVVRYGTQTVLRGVDLKVRAGEVRVILGGSGCGKSTLLKQCVGLERPVSGAVEMFGTRIDTLGESELADLMRRVGMLFQGGALLNSMTVLENVMLPVRAYRDALDDALRAAWPASVIEEMAQMKLRAVGLADAGKKRPSQLSGGMRKRAALARAMVLDPDLLFCDEPSAGLDPVTAARLDDLLLAIRDQFGMTLVVVTHELASIERIADSVTMLHEGKVLADGAFSEVRRSEHEVVREFFDRRPGGDGPATRTLMDWLVGAAGREAQHGT